MKKILSIVMIAVLLPLLSGCSQEDDVTSIFTGKVWKLSFITLGDSSTPYSFGMSKEQMDQEYAAEQTPEYLTVTFSLSPNSPDSGNFTATGTLSYIRGKWSADGSTNQFTTSDVPNIPMDNNRIAREMFKGLKNAYRYSGDTRNLYIYYKEGQNTFRLAFTPYKK